MNNKHVMVDIETFGNQSYSSIVSIGAVEFDINNGYVGKKFYTNVSLKSCLDLGLIVNADTIYWWLKQGEQARKDLVESEQLSISESLTKFSDFINEVGTDCEIWGNSNRFDLGILSDAYNKCNIKIPWNFRNERDVRTLVSFNPKIKEEMKYVGTQHNAIDDCLYQIQYCSKIWNSLKKLDEI